MKMEGPSTFPVPEVDDLNQDIGENFDITELIGSGGMGAVFLGTQAGLGRKVAIKILPGKIEGLRSRFLAEAKVLAQCSHPNIVSVFDFGETQSGIPYIVMEYIEGGDLETKIEQGNISDGDLFSWLRQICDGLAYAHSRDMVHLDIKPANLLITDKGDVKIVDFGLARIVGKEKQKSVGGTALYAAPETMTNDEGVDQRADIYSLGVVIYQMLTGKIPKGMWLPPSKADPTVNPAFDRIIDYALKKSLAARYQNIVELETDLTEIFFSLPDTEKVVSRVDSAELKKRLAYVFFGLFVSQVMGSAFNVWYNQRHIIPLFFEGESNRFINAVNVYHILAYTPLLSFWGWLVFSLLREKPDSQVAKRRVINLPWFGAGISAIGWAGTIPAVWIPLRDAGLDFGIQLTISVCIGAAIALSQVFLVVDLLCQKLLYKHFFSSDEKPWSTSGAISLSLTRRGLIWAVSSGICPVIALLLLVSEDHRLFAVSAALACISFAFFGSWLLGKLIVDPLHQLSAAAARVGGGDLRTRVDLVGTDELGILGFEFNRMVTGLRERQYIRESLGRTSGHSTTEAILNRKESLDGMMREVVIVAVYLEGYQRVIATLPPDEAIRLTEDFAVQFTNPVERFRGITHQNLGDAFTAAFGATPESRSPVDEANKAALALFKELNSLFANHEVTIGIGVAGGPALTGTIDVLRQREVVVAGDVVNRATRLALGAKSEIVISEECQRKNPTR